MPLRNRNRNTIPAFKVGGQAPFEFGNALQFDGVNDYVDVGNNLNPNINNNFGFSCWFKTTDSTFISNRVPNSFIGFNNSFWRSMVGINGGKIASLSFDGSFQYNEGSTSFDDGLWHCMTCIRTIGASNLLGSISVYVDGNLEINSQPFNCDAQTYQWKDIGKGRNTDNFNGILDELVFYQSVGLNVGLSEHNLFYNNGNGALATDVFTNIYAYYNCNGTSGDSTLLDSINSYNGTLTNFNTATCWVAH